jgi:hypothetical protein
VLKIQRSNNHGSPVLAISGRIEEKQVPQLQTLLMAESGARYLTLDLGELRLVHGYIREWIEPGSGNSYAL